MQQPYLSSPPDAGGVPHRSAKTPAKAQGQHAGVHIPWRSSAAPSAVNASTAVAEPVVASAAPVASMSGPERTFRVPHPVLECYLVADCGCERCVACDSGRLVGVECRLGCESRF